MQLCKHSCVKKPYNRYVAIGIEINCMDCIKQNSQKKPRRPWNQARPETSEGEFYEDRRI